MIHYENIHLLELKRPLIWQMLRALLRVEQSWGSADRIPPKLKLISQNTRIFPLRQLSWFTKIKLNFPSKKLTAKLLSYHKRIDDGLGHWKITNEFEISDKWGNINCDIQTNGKYLKWVKYENSWRTKQNFFLYKFYIDLKHDYCIKQAI